MRKEVIGLKHLKPHCRKKKRSRSRVSKILLSSKWNCFHFFSFIFSKQFLHNTGPIKQIFNNFFLQFSEAYFLTYALLIFQSSIGLNCSLLSPGFISFAFWYVFAFVASSLHYYTCIWKYAQLLNVHKHTQLVDAIFVTLFAFRIAMNVFQSFFFIIVASRILACLSVSQSVWLFDLLKVKKAIFLCFIENIGNKTTNVNIKTERGKESK